MAKKSKQASQGKKKQASSQKGGPGQRSMLYMALLGLALAAWMIWRLEPTLGLSKALLAGAVAGLAWAIFIFAYYMSQRSSRENDE